MSKQEPRLPERLSAVGATDLERRLLDAASSEQPPRELSERMARAIGVALPPITSAPSGGADGAGAAAPKGAAASSSLWPWLGGALVAPASYSRAGRTTSRWRPARRTCPPRPP